VIDIQNEGSAAQGVEVTKGGGGKKGKGRDKLDRVDDAGSEDAADAGDAMDVDEDDDQSLIPLPTSGGIQDLREKLHAKMHFLRRGAQREGRYGDEEAGSKDELLEERRKQRALLRERRRKETKEKIRRQEEERGKKGKGRERDQGKQTPAKVCLFFFLSMRLGFSSR
jgi:hypothetical protein